jgi:hypothetical protein
MSNVQWLGERSTIAKYILKYVTKFDKCNKVETRMNPHSGNVQTDSTFLHNTKITSLAMAEKKKTESKRTKDHHVGREIADTEILHLLLGETELIYNIRFKFISTQSYKIRNHYKIKLKEKRPVSFSDRGRGHGRANRDFHVSGSYNDIDLDLEADHHSSDISSVRSCRDDLRSQTYGLLSRFQQFTANQCEIIQDNHISTRKYDAISELGIRPPELVYVFF